MSKKKHAKKAKQGTLQLVESFMGYPAPSVHSSDASVEAAEKIEPHRSRLCQEVYETIKQFGPVTDEKIAYYAQMNPSTARPRRLELQREGLIVQAGHGKTSAGRKAALWATA